MIKYSNSRVFPTTTEEGVVVGVVVGAYAAPYVDALVPTSEKGVNVLRSVGGWLARGWSAGGAGGLAFIIFFAQPEDFFFAASDADACVG